MSRTTADILSLLQLCFAGHCRRYKKPATFTLFLKPHRDHHLILARQWTDNWQSMHAEDLRKMFTIDLGASTGTTDLISYDWWMTMTIITTIIFLINPVHNTEFYARLNDISVVHVDRMCLLWQWTRRWIKLRLAGCSTSLELRLTPSSTMM